MFIKIYFNDSPLFLCDGIDSSIEPYMHHDDAVFIDEFSSHAIKSVIHEMQQSKIHAGIMRHDNVQELKKAVWKKFTIIKAAGGLVLNQQKDILMIYRRGKWDLPKGKLDPGETLEACAVREVEEETGLRNITLGESLLTTYHTYHESGKFMLKESYWYKMTADGNQALTPQTTEDIHKIDWVNEKKTSEYLKNSFPSIVDVVEQYRQSLSAL
jgi:8-oxo-dGTP pyrophosphatase MutT (NUDIX family)